MNAFRRISMVWMLAALLLAIRAMVPTGWMPVAEKDGIRIALCTGHGAVTAFVDADGKLDEDANKDAEGQQTPREVCPYGVMALAAPLPELAVLAEPLQPEAQVPVPLPHFALIPYPHGSRPPTRGPPALA